MARRLGIRLETGKGEEILSGESRDRDRDMDDSGEIEKDKGRTFGREDVVVRIV